MTDEVPRPGAARRRAAELYLAFALLFALAPAALLAVGWAAVQAGLSDWRGGLGLLAADSAPRLALAGVASGAVALVVALLAGFRRHWRRALIILAITTATLGLYMWNATKLLSPAAAVSSRPLI